ncbi:hypothetical protein SAMN02745121_04952 [Nannocystis exedens]|uniref:Uncharacterized protein n=1 Tax=Nannocystis exedens TaxID=54 RepID=A0A1I2C3E3_9BACT|nr:hypothetical protein [Nannocystis exedens]PCC71085.1 hypothetical protein NAEX_04158 [Nannocystis exedens]SFE62859.1 hypothetical protein SAMN02745121_04952 [Nannocystis exedens]
MRNLLASCSLLLVACPADEAMTVSSAGSTAEPPSTGTTTGPAPTPSTTDPAEPTTTTGPTSTTGEEGVAGLELMPRLAGLWSGPASMTPLGTFPRMNMDVRAASSQVLFSRADLDANNNLRFAFEVEDHGSGPVLVYRNGGYFLGLLRDSRAVLTEHTASSWRFCSATKGCEYIDAAFSFDGDDHLILDVKVKGVQHVYWDALREETRALPEPFPADTTPLAPDAPFPPMPSLKIDVGWAAPLEEEGGVWAIVTTEPCDLQFTCKHSRSLLGPAAAGSTSASLLLDQIHAGDYKLTVVLDRNGNMAETLFPDAGDGVSAPNQAVTVAPSGETSVKATIVVDL